MSTEEAFRIADLLECLHGAIWEVHGDEMVAILERESRLKQDEEPYEKQCQNRDDYPSLEELPF
jgi:hypothetical protein